MQEYLSIESNYLVTQQKCNTFSCKTKNHNKEKFKRKKNQAETNQILLERKIKKNSELESYKKKERKKNKRLSVVSALLAKPIKIRGGKNFELFKDIKTK